MWQGVRHGHGTLLPWQLLSVFFLKVEKKEKKICSRFTTQIPQDSKEDE
jgi:hypothetical protein